MNLIKRQMFLCFHTLARNRQPIAFFRLRLAYITCRVNVKLTKNKKKNMCHFDKSHHWLDLHCIANALKTYKHIYVQPFKWLAIQHINLNTYPQPKNCTIYVLVCLFKCSCFFLLSAMWNSLYLCPHIIHIKNSLRFMFAHDSNAKSGIQPLSASNCTWKIVVWSMIFCTDQQIER